MAGSESDVKCTMEISKVTLREITRETVLDKLRLKVAPEQDNLVAPNSESIAEAYFEKGAWFRAIYADETPVGFVMTYEDHERPFFYLWRYMIDAGHQGKGYGSKALELLIERIKNIPNATEMKLSVVPEDGSAISFYEKFGFEDTGEVRDGEMVFLLKFDR